MTMDYPSPVPPTTYRIRVSCRGYCYLKGRVLHVSILRLFTFKPCFTDPPDRSLTWVVVVHTETDTSVVGTLEPVTDWETLSVQEVDLLPLLW